jgi:RND family efflux transporter MFP subunit
MASQTSAAEAGLHQAEGDLSQAQAQAAAVTSTYDKLAEAAKTPGAVAGNELIQAQKQKEAADALIASRKGAVKAAEDHLKATAEMQAYLRIVAPFDGIITDRLVHPGMMVSIGGQSPLLKLQQISHLRLIVPVPESYVASVARGKSVTFHVPARPSKTFAGTIARIPHALDPQSRSMMVELDVPNSDGVLAPGMYPTVEWPVASGSDLFLVPTTSVVTTTKRTFVITSQNGNAHWVDVKKGLTSGEQVLVSGDLRVGQSVVKRATDEMRDGHPLR